MAEEASFPVEQRDDLTFIRQVGSLKQQVCREANEAGGQASGHCMNLIDTYLWNGRAFLRRDSLESRQRKEKKLRELVAICRSGEGDQQTLHRAVMEIPQLALEPDREVIKALATLVHHKNMYVRVHVARSGDWGERKHRQVSSNWQQVVTLKCGELPREHCTNGKYVSYCDNWKGSDYAT